MAVTQMFFVLVDQRHNFSLVVCYSLKLSRCKITRCLLQNLLVAKNHSLLVVKFARYSLQKLLVAKKSLIARCKICSLLVAEVACSKKYLVFRCKFPSIRIAINHSLLKQLLAGIIVNKVEWKFQFFRYNLFPKAKKFKVAQVNMLP